MVLFTLQEDYSFCGNLSEADKSTQITDVTSHPRLMFQDAGFSSSELLPASLSYNTVSPTISDASTLVS